MTRAQANDISVNDRQWGINLLPFKSGGWWCFKRNTENSLKTTMKLIGNTNPNFKSSDQSGMEKQTWTESYRGSSLLMKSLHFLRAKKQKDIQEFEYALC